MESLLTQESLLEGGDALAGCVLNGCSYRISLHVTAASLLAPKRHYALCHKGYCTFGYVCAAIVIHG